MPLMFISIRRFIDFLLMAFIQFMLFVVLAIFGVDITVSVLFFHVDFMIPNRIT